MVHDTQPATTLAYVAGLIDGEGSISIGVSRDHPGRATPNYWLQVSVTNTDRTLIDWLLTSFGGHTSSNSHYHDAPKRRPCWAWRVMGPQAMPFLRAVLPYVRIKAPQVALALAFQEHMSAPRTYYRVPVAHLAVRETFRQRLRALNHRNTTIP